MNDSEEFLDLIARARQLNVELTERGAKALIALAEELARWSRAYNLTAIRERAEILTRHILDSLSIHEDLHGSAIADAGTGAGFPGLPLAVTNPERRFMLIDSSGKKARFVEHAVRLLDLENVEVVKMRVEDLRPKSPFDTIVARAFAPLPDLLERVDELVEPGTLVLAMKGRYPRAELASVAPPWRVERTRPIVVPGLEAARHVVQVRRSESYPPGRRGPILASP